MERVTNLTSGSATRARKAAPGLHRASVIQRESAAAAPESIPSIVHDVLRSPGEPLDAATRAFMEPRFGHDFSKVRVHTDAKAAQSAQAVRARAYTFGRDIVFGAARFAPDTVRGQRLLAHELSHVVQQSNALTSPGEQTATVEHEREAERMASIAGRDLTSHALHRTVAADIELQSSRQIPASYPSFSAVGAQLQRLQLTYDDGPDKNTGAVLKALNAAAARATFYVVGKRVAQGNNWRIVFDIAASGHWIGNHAFDWNDAKDDHIFLHGTVEERAQKILNTEWAIRDALIQGRDEAKKNKSWDALPQSNRAYIDDVIAHGTGRFRTPGFQSHMWNKQGQTTMAAIESVNQVLAASGVRPLAMTMKPGASLPREGVTIDPEDYKKGRTRAGIEADVKKDLKSNTDTILLHSRVEATADATPGIVKGVTDKKFTFDPTAQGAPGSKMPKPGFAKLSTISDPPTSSEIAAARKFFRSLIPSYGGYVAGSVALGIFQMAQRAGRAEVDDFAKEIRNTQVDTKDGKVPLANWMQDNPEWKLFTTFFENWMTNKPFPRIKGVTI